MSIANVISVSGGKDSTATALIAANRGVENLSFVFADTGHEHSITYEYIEYLDGVLRQRTGVGITTVRADFSSDMARKRKFIAEHWPGDGVPQERVDAAIEALQPSGSPMLDLCLLKGRFPSSRVRFCTTELKHKPISEQVIDPLIDSHEAVISWQGVRADESLSRANLPERDIEFGSWEPEPRGVLIYRPIISWTAEDVFDFQRENGVMHNPLYEKGMGRVGCMPCIMARKGELRAIAQRFPEYFERLAKYEKAVSLTSKRGASSFFSANVIPGHVPGTEAADPQSAYGAEAVARWAMTARGGRQFDLLADAEDADQCTSIYGLCE